MWAYVDESGNTGNRIFDEDQPLFITAAMMTKTNFDLVRDAELTLIARKVGQVALHANELGVARIEEIADDLLRIIKQADARFFVSRLEKRYLAAAKVYDTYFDAGENLAVPWHVYWLKPLRLTMMFKLSQFVITEDIAMTVWDCVTAPNEQKSKAAFLEAANAMLVNVPNLPDLRSRQIVSEALQWALDNPENFGTHIRDKINRYGHSPNFVAFTNLLDGLNQASNTWKRPIREIVHDRQSQFERTLQQWHAVVSSPKLANAEPINWPGEKEPLSVSKVMGSKFRIATEETSPGLQVIDVVLWLFKRSITGKEIGPRGARLLNRVFQRGHQNDMSFEGVGDAAEQSLDNIMSAALSDKQQAAGAQMLIKNEEHRVAAMKEYAAQKTASVSSS
jgi:hypothetical protein